MIKVGIAGFGFMGQFHYRAYREIKDVRVAALFDSDGKVFEREGTAGNLGAAGIGDLKGIAKFTDFDRFLAQDLDVVDICAPTFVHREFTERALKSGRAVLVEKPMALNVGDCDAMIDAARKAGKLLMVGQCVRFWPGCDQILDAARAAAWGAPLSATLRRIGGAPSWSGWFLKERLSGGAVLDLLVHDFDFARAAFGLPSAVAARGVAEAFGEGSGVSYCRADLGYPGGPPCVTIEGGWMTGPAYPFSMTAIFQFQRATMAFGIEPGSPLAVYRQDGKKELPPVSIEQGYYFEIKYFLECLEQGKRPERCPPEESRDAIAMALAARESILKGGQAVPLHKSV